MVSIKIPNEKPEGVIMSNYSMTYDNAQWKEYV